MENQKTIDVLNKLVEINNDRIEGYETASKETDETDLLTLFSGFIQTSKKCRAELAAEVTKLGGTPTDGTKTSGKFFRLWMDLKAALTANDRKTVLNSCEFGEDAAVRTYQEVLADESDYLKLEQLAMIRVQYTEIKAGHDKVRNLRDSVAQAS